MRYDSKLEAATGKAFFRHVKEGIRDHIPVTSYISFSNEDLEKAYSKAVAEFKKVHPTIAQEEIPSLASFRTDKWELDFIIPVGEKDVHIDVRDDWTHDYTFNMAYDSKSRQKRSRTILIDYMKEILLLKNSVKTVIVRDYHDAENINKKLRFV